MKNKNHHIHRKIDRDVYNTADFTIQVHTGTKVVNYDEYSTHEETISYYPVSEIINLIKTTKQLRSLNLAFSSYAMYEIITTEEIKAVDAALRQNTTLLAVTVYYGGVLGDDWKYSQKITNERRQFYKALSELIEHADIYTARNIASFKANQSAIMQYMITNPLCPYLSLLSKSSNATPKIQDCETYPRSAKSPTAKMSKEKAYQIYKNRTDLGQGRRANVGAYGNAIQMLGDTQAPNHIWTQTTSGNAFLYNLLLERKLATCNHIFQSCNQKATTYLKVGFYNQYPCIMVKIDKNSVIKHKANKKKIDSAFKDWVNLLISFYTAIINYYAYKNSIPIEITRRSSFGFNSVHIAPTAESFRINVGIIPIAYANILIKGLLELELILTNLINNPNKAKIPNNTFFKTRAHQKYLNTQKTPYSPNQANNLLELLWEPVDRQRKTTLQNLMRTAYARHLISALMFNLLIENRVSNFTTACITALQTVIRKFTIKNSKTLTLKQDTAIKYSVRFSKKTNPLFDQPLADSDFWDVIIHIKNALLHKQSYFFEGFDELEDCIRRKSLYKLYFYLEMINQSVFQEAVANRNNNLKGNGYGSDSETEDEIDGTTLYANKLITHNGMRSILRVLEVVGKLLIKNNHQCRVYLDLAYYETEMGSKLTAKIEQFSTHFTIAKKESEANVLIYDINACITKGTNKKISTNDPKKILILDSTSSTTMDCYEYLLKLAQSRRTHLFFVSSGLKNEQCSGDRNQYGTIRIFAKDAKQLFNFYRKLRASEPPLISPISHAYRRNLKEKGLVPTNKSFFHQALVNNFKPILRYRPPKNLEPIVIEFNTDPYTDIVIEETPFEWGETMFLLLSQFTIHEMRIMRETCTFWNDSIITYLTQTLSLPQKQYSFKLRNKLNTSLLRQLLLANNPAFLRMLKTNKNDIKFAYFTFISIAENKFLSTIDNREYTLVPDSIYINNVCVINHSSYYFTLLMLLAKALTNAIEQNRTIASFIPGYSKISRLFQSQDPNRCMQYCHSPSVTV